MNVDRRQYDPELQMFRDGPREPNIGKLRFLRWLVEGGKLGYGIIGQATGIYKTPDEEITNAATLKAVGVDVNKALELRNRFYEDRLARGNQPDKQTKVAVE